MYKVEVKKAPDSEACSEEIKFILDDFVNAIDINLPEGSNVSRDGNLFSIDSKLEEQEIKDLMEPTFSYHFDHIRFVRISKTNISK